MLNKSEKSWQIEYAFTFNQGYYFTSVGYFSYSKFKNQTSCDLRQ